MNNVSQWAVNLRDKSCMESFGQLYRHFSVELRKRLRKDMEATGTTDEVAMYDFYVSTFDSCIATYDETKTAFTTYFMNSLNLRRPNVWTSNTRKKKKEKSLSSVANGSSDQETTFDIKDNDIDLENEIIESLGKMQFIEDLVARANCELTRRAVALFPHYKTYTALSKALGVDRRKVKKLILGLAKHYDPAIDGPLNMYGVSDFDGQACRQSLAS